MSLVQWKRGERDRVGARSGGLLVLGAAVLTATGCHHGQRPVAYAPPPPPSYSPTGSRYSPSAEGNARASSHYEPGSGGAAAEYAPPGFFDSTAGAPVLTETGIASWYGPKYNHHAAADGTVFDQDEPTAAHRTLPLGTTVRVTNLATGEQTLVRITDRGPFVPGRVLDLSEGAAKAIGLYRMGIAEVRVEAFAHVSTDPAGRWAVQTGPFSTERDALDLKAALMDRYRGAKVAEFQGPTGFWVRIDPANHSRVDALEEQDWIGHPDARSNAYLVRID